MKTDVFFQYIKDKSNVKIINIVDENIKFSFEMKYQQFKDKFFFEQFTKCGGIIVENWVRLYGCGELNVILKNELYNRTNDVDIIIGEDILGGLFALKNGSVFYYAPDMNRWEDLRIFYTEFLDWLINSPNNVNKFYELYRWCTWQEDCKHLKNNEGVTFYPTLQFNCDIEQRSKKIISIDELIRFNLGI